MSSWVGDDIPIDVPSAARMYDYFLGGYHNFAPARQAAEVATSFVSMCATAWSFPR